MKANKEFKVLRDLPGVGVSIEKDLLALGFRTPQDLVGASAEKMYKRWQEISGGKERCMLYTFKCAIYAAETPTKKRKAKLMQWWGWKDYSFGGICKRYK